MIQVHWRRNTETSKSRAQSRPSAISSPLYARRLTTSDKILSFATLSHQTEPCTLLCYVSVSLFCSFRLLEHVSSPLSFMAQWR